MRTANYTELCIGLNTYLDTVVQNREPLIVHRSSSNSVVIISLEEYNALSETAYIASSPVMMKRINSAEANIMNGKGLKINIDNFR
ncbi:MAG: type II toxin-antitoxin system prevent-host-death family antitoxin [Bacteroidetes bacterium]|nr:type II toxin-antitoxin system prevent-host-death family antitoxin [Bacteroidota bacterium]MCL1968167.1 type II toxin-antitoxin system prevent-host-death family antitoxin [Bacteroidota bacterium]